MTPSQLKAEYIKHRPNGYFFSRRAMAVFGDTMANYRVIDRGYVWELARKLPVSCDITRSQYFSKINLDSSSDLDYFDNERIV